MSEERDKYAMFFAGVEDDGSIAVIGAPDATTTTPDATFTFDYDTWENGLKWRDRARQSFNEENAKFSTIHAGGDVTITSDYSDQSIHAEVRAPQTGVDMRGFFALHCEEEVAWIDARANLLRLVDMLETAHSTQLKEEE